MFRFISRFSVSAACVVALAGCASTPNSSTLLTGISPVDAAKTFPAGQTRLATDPVCATFYANAQNFIAASKSPGAGDNFLKSLGVNVLSSVATVFVPTAGISNTAGRIAAQSAASSAISQGSRLTINEVSKSSAPGAKIAKAAEELNCPVAFAP